MQNLKNPRKNKKKSDKDLVIDGLKKLASGKINDAVSLVFAEDIPPPEQLARLQLFNISSVKRVKGGGVEVQFFDRQKALEKLYEYALQDENLSDNLLRALTDPEQIPDDSGNFKKSEMPDLMA
ncbi:MAG: terminase small subunit [Oscillospiraceae bacterium]|nr:terminase small subunit [Oscillospiraceae bacterium]MDE7121717.1 terminase small subunit [Oscillospiraceae bacterium]